MYLYPFESRFRCSEADGLMTQSVIRLCFGERLPRAADAEVDKILNL